MDQFAIMPAAITMVAGPQIISAVVLATSRKPKSNSLGYIAGVALATSLGVAVTFAAASFLKSASEGVGGTSGSDWLTYGVVALLVVAAIRAFLTRKTAKPPKWLTKLQDAEPSNAFKVGFLLFILMPSDIVVMISVGSYLAANGLTYAHAIPFILLTVAFIASPLLAYLALGQRAEKALPKLRDWMNANSWLINIAIYAFFIYLFLA